MNKELMLAVIKTELARLLASEDSLMSLTRVENELSVFLQRSVTWALLTVEFPPWKLSGGIIINPAKLEASLEEFTEWYIRPMVNVLLSSRKH